MKQIITLSLIVLSMTINAQNKNAQAVIEVDGVCGMCKARIEKAAIKTPGVKSAVWSTSTHELQLIYNERKTKLSQIEENIATAGHDTAEVKAKQEDYENLHECCKYRSTETQKEHQ